MRLLVALLVWLLRASLVSRGALVMEIASRRIVLINATTNPGLAWVKQQIRQATAWSQSPRFLLHDNDGIFGQFRDL